MNSTWSMVGPIYLNSLFYSQFQLDKSRIKEWNRLAPEGCQQFFTEPAGNIVSFNFNKEDPMKSRYQPNLNYKICIRPNDKSQASKGKKVEGFRFILIDLDSV